MDHLTSRVRFHRAFRFGVLGGTVARFRTYAGVSYMRHPGNRTSAASRASCRH